MYGPDKTNNGNYLPALTILIILKYFRLKIEDSIIGFIWAIHKALSLQVPHDLWQGDLGCEQI
jgi:hypothetical protein